MPEIIKNKKTIAIFSIILFLIIGTFIVFIKERIVYAYTSAVYSSPTLSCSVTDLACSGATILKLSDYRGGHAELPSQSNYPYKVCCTGSGVSNLSSGAVAFRVSNNRGGTDAHVETNGLNNSAYSNNAYLSSSGTVTCGYSNTASCASLGADYVCLAEVGGSNSVSPSGITNAHVAACDQVLTGVTGYVCCRGTNPVSPCTAIVASDKSIFLGNTNIQLCSGTDTSASYATDPCYSTCWKGVGQPDPSNTTNWACSVCHDNSNNPVSCSTLAGSTYAWTMPGGYTSPANYTIISGTLTSANPVVNFTDSSTNRQLGLQVTSGNGPVCSQTSIVKRLPIWRPVSPF